MLQFKTLTKNNWHQLLFSQNGTMGEELNDFATLNSNGSTVVEGTCSRIKMQWNFRHYHYISAINNIHTC